jgi:hypothetical protein
LARWLLQQESEVELINPVMTHCNKDNDNRHPSKNDAIDALTIADLVNRGLYTKYSLQAESFGPLGS